jgi:hypothetical protein
MRKRDDNLQPQVGIFWFVHGKLIFDSTSLAQAECYGEHLTHPRSHIDVWNQFQRLGKVPPESEYEEYPRGRVMHHPASGEFTILADKCITDRKELVSEIKKTLHLPVRKTKLGRMHESKRSMTKTIIVSSLMTSSHALMKKWTAPS